MNRLFRLCLKVPPNRSHGRKQGEKKDWERNDRIIAIEEQAHSFADIQSIDDLGKQFCRELEEFFVNYHRLTGKEYKIIGVKGKKRRTEINQVLKTMNVKPLYKWRIPASNNNSLPVSTVD
jgi:hypothetical protein